MTENFYLFDSRKASVRISLVLVVVVAVFFMWVSVKWQIGSMLAELTPPSRPDANQVSKYSIELAPRDPYAWWLAATTEKDLFTPEKIDSSLRMSEQSVRLAPDDFRLWTELGRAYEQSGEPEKAEAAFDRAVALAPSYAYPHWQLGNFLIRQSRPEEAIGELRKSTAFNTSYRDEAYSLIWNYFENDPAKVEELAADSVDARVGLAQFFAWHGRSGDALRIWNSLGDEDKENQRGTARAIAEAMNEKRTFWEGVEFARQSQIDPNAEVEKITNGGFEETMLPANETLYGWKINRSENKAESVPDSTVKHSGARSLRTIFRSYLNPNFYGIWQNVAVRTSTKYRLRFWVRTENLKSAGPPMIEVVNASDDTIIAVSKPISSGTVDWQEVVIDFTSPEICSGLYVRTSRAYCGDNCPLVGTMWLDDFELTSG